MANAGVESGVQIENGSLLAESNEKVVTVDNPETDQSPPREPSSHVKAASTLPESPKPADPEARTNTPKVNGKTKRSAPPSNGAPKTYAAVVAGKPADGAVIEHDHHTYPKLPTLDEIRREREGWRAGGIHFAPLRVPMIRRMQTGAVLFHCMSIGLFVSIFWLICANPLTWPILVPYLIHLTLSTAATNGKLSYRSEYMRSLPLWKLFVGYFPMKLHKTYDLDPKRKYIFGYHPHGIISHGAWAAFVTNALGFADLFPGITNTLLTLDSNFRLPFNRDWILLMGLQSVSKESIWNILNKGGPKNDGQGRAVTIVVGGARESLEAQPGTLRLILKGRKGFVKMALRTGADLVPVIGFGENDLYDQLSPKTHPLVHQLQMIFLKVFKFTVPALHGRGVMNYDVGFMPYRRPVNIVVGKPIQVDRAHGPQPKQREIDLLHEKYVQEIEKLWATYKDQFAAGVELEIIS
ncbi:diacylglycerol acyltransferase-domain-containing protein [Ilyonectria robusta]|uniref:diacylglycerol acyltransferase-domain-containing protein n=1 Tax=Ilyonectria robusta TaxID=1079257 RepID=UPI001E8E2712|nr:diacylglycerol acyltransferase-domain-containing protein [Ilyonectria robusta]KAH8735396.1 diacylglycerol acyltransferase-domain-containing protein [Ilyonectria robusta]